MSMSPLLFLNDKIKFQLFGIFPLPKVDSTMKQCSHKTMVLASPR